MKIVLILFLSFHFATGGALLEEVVKMPFLMEHFQLHRSQSPDMSFTRFLWLHYVDVAHQHAGNEHSQLPMHSFHVHGTASALSQPPVFALSLSPSISIPKSHKAAFHYQFLLPGGTLFGIFQPPKTA